MELQQICWDLFQQNGQIGYYLLRRQLEQEDEVGGCGAISAGDRDYSAQQGL